MRQKREFWDRTFLAARVRRTLEVMGVSLKDFEVAYAESRKPRRTVAQVEAEKAELEKKLREITASQ